jgi:hypothetical protein
MNQLTRTPSCLGATCTKEWTEEELLSLSWTDQSCIKATPRSRLAEKTIEQHHPPFTIGLGVDLASDYGHQSRIPIIEPMTQFISIKSHNTGFISGFCSRGGKHIVVNFKGGGTHILQNRESHFPRGGGESTPWNKPCNTYIVGQLFHTYMYTCLLKITMIISRRWCVPVYVAAYIVEVQWCQSGRLGYINNWTTL